MDLGQTWHTGPYAERARDLLSAHRDAVRALFYFYDTEAAQARGSSPRWVITHGEPFGPNLLQCADGRFKLVDWDSLLPKLQTSDVRIVGVSLSADIRKPAKKRKLSAKEKMDQAELKKGFVEADASLRHIASATGGRVYFAQNTKEFGKAYAEIAELLRHEYSLAFAPAVFDGKVHTLRVKRSGVRIDHRPAYLAGASAAQ